MYSSASLFHLNRTTFLEQITVYRTIFVLLLLKHYKPKKMGAGVRLQMWNPTLHMRKTLTQEIAVFGKQNEDRK